MLELLRRKPKEPKPNPVIMINERVGIEVERGAVNGFDLPTPNIYNLETAHKHGIKLLTLNDVLRQIEPELHNNLILFDTLPNDYFGNRYRVTSTDQRNPQLKVCSATGAWDAKGVLPFEPPEDFAMFTGADIAVVKDNEGKLVPLSEAQKYWQAHKDDPFFALMSNIHHKGNIRMWSNSEGEIRSQLELPIAS